MKNFFVLLLLLVTVSEMRSQQNTLDSLLHQDLYRKYIVHTPTGYEPSDTLPLIVLLHGGSGSAASAINFTEFNDTADANYLLTVYPEGIGPAGQGYSWADGRGTSADMMGIDDVGFLDKLLNKLSVDYTIDQERIYFTGFSNGGFMTLRFACEVNDRIAAIAPLGCTMGETLFENCDPQNFIPTLFMMGTADPFVPYDGGMMANGVEDVVSTQMMTDLWRGNNNCLTELPPVNLPDIDPTDNCTVTVFEYTDCDCAANVTLYRINNGGHTWPGVENKVYELIAGDTNEDIHASDEIWGFFSQHTYCDETLGNNQSFKNNQIILSSNPVGGTLTLSNIDAFEALNYSIINVHGQEIKTGLVKASINVEALKSGVYFISFEGRDIYQTLTFLKK